MLQKHPGLDRNLNQSLSEFGGMGIHIAFDLKAAPG